MRIARLDLVRYGKFTDRTLHFGPAHTGRPDLHVVYGPNEAGKSTAFAAYLDLLFGIRATKEPNYAFLHPYPTMRIGARLDLSGGPRDLVRIRRAQTTLLDADDRPVDEGLITAELGGIGRDAYRSMFSLDDDSLEQGGDEILASRGDLGQILFSGSAGAAGFSRALDAMRGEADRFFRPGAQKTGLNDLRAELDALKAARDDADVQAPAYKRLVEEHDRAAEAHDAALKARGDAAARRDEIGRLLSALPRLARLRALRAASLPSLALGDPPAGWADELPDIEKNEIRLQAELQAATRDADDLVRERDGIVTDPAALALAGDHGSLAALRAAAVTAAKDLPRRRPDLADVEAAVEAAMSRLGRPTADSDGAALPAAVSGTLRALLAERSGIAARLDDAQAEAAAAAANFAEARDALAVAGGAAGDQDAGAAWPRLAGLVEALRAADPLGCARGAERALSRAERGTADTLLALTPWPGTADDLARLVLPSQGDADSWAVEVAGAEAEAVRRDGEAADLAGERDALRAQVDALGRLAGPISDAEALASRAGRERAWAAHRARLDGESSDDFEDAMRRDDAIVAARFGQAGDVARLKEVSLALAASETRLRGATERAAAARRRGEEQRVAVGGVAASLDPPFPKAPTPAGFAAWLARTGPVLIARAEARDAAEAWAAAVEDGRTWRRRLEAALAEVSITSSPDAELDGLAAAARVAVDRRAALEGLATDVARARTRLTDRTATLERAREAEATWHARWAEACAACWLGDGGPAPSPAAVSEILDILSALAPDVRTRADLRHRIAAMEADQECFAARVTGLAASLALGPDAAEDPGRIIALDMAVGRRIAEAEAARAALAACHAKLSAVEARRSQVAEAVSANAVRAARLLSFFGVDTLAEVGARLKLCEERDRLRRDAGLLEDEIRSGLRRPDIASAEALLDGLDAAALEAECDAVCGLYDAADLDLRASHSARAAAQSKLDGVGGDDAVARIEARRRVILLDIEDQARGFIRLKGGIAAAEQALATYRDRHRSEMLKDASRAFEMVSRGAYAGLAAQPSDKGEILIARTADGKSKQATDLSKGTRFQLYLALRAAGYRAFATARRPVPFVADDIMETFDDFRAEEAFRLFAAMAEVGQVIYLTHHRHLVEIARAACPAVTVHDLTAAA